MTACAADSFPGSAPFTIPGSFAACGGTNCAGTLTKWVRDVYYAPKAEAAKRGGPDAYTVMAQEAAQVPPGSNGLIVLPYFYSERSPINAPEAKGVLFGLTGSHTRREINRAAPEAAAYSLGSHMRMFQNHGLTPESVIIAGGGTKNPVCMQIAADVIGMPVQVAENWQTASYGDACMAAIGCGLLQDFPALKVAMPLSRPVAPILRRIRFVSLFPHPAGAEYKNLGGKHMKRIVSLLLAMLMMLSLVGCGNKNSGSNGTWPIDGTNQYICGYDVQVARKICETYGWELKIIKTDWEGLIPGVVSGKLDCCISTLGVTEERLRSVDFSDYYWNNGCIMAVRKDGPYVDATSIQDFDGAKITTQIATIWEPLVQQIPNVQAEPCLNSLPELFITLSAGKMDGVITGWFWESPHAPPSTPLGR